MLFDDGSVVKKLFLCKYERNGCRNVIYVDVDFSVENVVHFFVELRSDVVKEEVGNWCFGVLGVYLLVVVELFDCEMIEIEWVDLMSLIVLC